jgi:hypothetical protein
MMRKVSELITVDCVFYLVIVNASQVYLSMTISSGLAAVSGGRSSPPLHAGGGGGPPCILASRRWGPTYIASYTHTLGPWVDFFWISTAVDVVGKLVTTWAGERILRQCL